MESEELEMSEKDEVRSFFQKIEDIWGIMEGMPVL
jgi:hypothetical protein